MDAILHTSHARRNQYMLIPAICSLLLTSILFTTIQDGAELLQQFQVLKNSIYNQRGLAPGDKEVISTLRDKMSDWTAEHDDFQVLAAELQMSIWLGNDAQCNPLFEKLTELQPENTSLALAWGDYLMSLEDADPNAVFSDLITRFPNSPEIALGWARTLETKNQFTQAISAIERLDDSALETPEIAQFYANALYADNRFQESIHVLSAVDSSLLVADPALSTRFSAQKSRSQTAKDKWDIELSIREVEEFADDLPIAIIETSKGDIELVLFEDHAPNTVANFVSLADSGYYDGILFHRVLAKFMAQGGDPNSREGAAGNPGEGGPGYSIKDEHTNDDSRNHFAGTLSMAKTPAPNTGGSQFFLTHLPTPHLDGRHTVFGTITSGLDTARSIEKDDEIISITITRKRDHEYVPEKIGEVTEETKLEENKNPELKATSEFIPKK